MDPALGERFVTAGIELIAERGLHRLNSDVLARRIHAGKAAFYRRWINIDEFLVDVVRRLAAQPVPYPEPRTPASDLVAVVLHQVDGDRGAVLTELLGRLPHNPALREAWLSGGGPFMTQFDAIVDIAGQLGIAGTFRLHLGVDQLIAEHRERRLLRANEPIPATLVEKQVDELLADVVGRTPAAAGEYRP